MNKARRKDLARIVAKLELLDTVREDLMADLESIRDEEQEALDNLPESLQESERGEQMQEYIDTMEEILDDLEQLDIEDMVDRIQEVIG